MHSRSDQIDAEQTQWNGGIKDFFGYTYKASMTLIKIAIELLKLTINAFKFILDNLATLIKLGIASAFLYAFYKLYQAAVEIINLLKSTTMIFQNAKDNTAESLTALATSLQEKSSETFTKAQKAISDSTASAQVKLSETQESIMALKFSDLQDTVIESAISAKAIASQKFAKIKSVMEQQTASINVQDTVTDSLSSIKQSASDLITNIKWFSDKTAEVVDQKLEVSPATEASTKTIMHYLTDIPFVSKVIDKASKLAAGVTEEAPSYFPKDLPPTMCYWSNPTSSTMYAGALDTKPCPTIPSLPAAPALNRLN